MRGAVAIAMLLAGCEHRLVDPALVEQVNALEGATRRGRAEVDALEQRSARLRLELQQMQERLESARCQATRAEIRATAARMVAQCQEERIRFARCNADAAHRSADNTLMGGFLGLAAAALTGGAAAPFVLGGTVLGRASDDGSGACGTLPSCSVTASDYRSDAMREHQLTALPACREPEPVEAPSSNSCFFAMPTSFHLRPVESTEDLGPTFPAGTDVMIVRAGTIVRSDGRRVALTRLRDGREGWVYFWDSELVRHQCGARL